LLPAAHLRGTSARSHHGSFQRLCLPLDNPPGHLIAVVYRSQHPFGSGAVMRGIGVQADPAIAGRVIACHGVPQRRQAPALGANAGGEPQGAQTSVHLHPGARAGLAGEQVGDGQARGGNAGTGQFGDFEGRWQGSCSVQVQVLKRILG
jgi:hypothetical protein